MMDIMVSVICTNYNKGQYIQNALDSFLKQETNFPFEIICVDDASTDQSKNIIQQYANNYPEKIRAFFHSENIGITKTWIQICKEAKGKYIARCDGDDYWLDPLKLQKQVDFLESNSQSNWCTCDFCIIDENGKIQVEHAFESNKIPLITTFEDMLIYKGFTCPSSWLIDTKLMNEVNAIIDEEATDDTFNIQLEFFLRTKLDYIPEQMTAYRVLSGSDSRPESKESIEKRFKGLLKAQLYYLEKNINLDYLLLSKRLLEKDNQNDIAHIIQNLDKKLLVKQFEQLEETLLSIKKALINEQ